MSLASLVDSALQQMFAIRVVGHGAQSASSASASESQRLIVIAVVVGVALVFLAAYCWNAHAARRKQKADAPSGHAK